MNATRTSIVPFDLSARGQIFRTVAGHRFSVSESILTSAASPSFTLAIWRSFAFHLHLERLGVHDREHAALRVGAAARGRDDLALLGVLADHETPERRTIRVFSTLIAAVASASRPESTLASAAFNSASRRVISPPQADSAAAFAATRAWAASSAFVAARACEANRSKASAVTTEGTRGRFLSTSRDNRSAFSRASATSRSSVF